MVLITSTFLDILFKILYAISVILLAFVGLSNVISVVIYLIVQKRAWSQPDPIAPKLWPRVTVQLPIYNEKFLACRVLDSVTKFDYPGDKLEIQVLDDSTDEVTSRLLVKLVKKYRDNGLDVVYLHREGRTGYKAGNLAFGMENAKGEFLAIFDADFIPPNDYLRKTVPYFKSEKIGFVQTRWGHLNFKHNLISRLAGTILDAHFVVEQNARYLSGLFNTFNGSAGIWRKKAIESVGGWQWDTMTEDVDMTFRSQIAGWKAVYLPKVVSPAELPQQMNDFKIQQYRWCRGTAQVSLKLMGKALPARLPPGVKFMAMLHLLSFLTFPLMIVLFMLVLPVAGSNPDFLKLFWWGAIVSIGPLLLFSLGKSENNPRFMDRLIILPVLLLTGVGISLVCGLSVVSGSLQKGGTFIRTTRVDPRIGREYDDHKKRTLNLFIVGEIAVALYLVLTVFLLWGTVGKLLLPWLGSSALGFLFVAALSIIENTQEASRARKTKAESIKEESLEPKKSLNHIKMYARKKSQADGP
jgi:cellulose synthase/poly-beta-1,6-N-acetylglucosamine synthase-like glycosyltransferase